MVQRAGHLRRSICLGVAAVSVLAAVPRPGPAATGCSAPRKSWTSAAPAAVGLDPVKLQDAFDWATTHQSLSVLVVRHGCLAGSSRLDPATSLAPLDGWSMTKSVTSMLVGRAVTLGILNLDTPIGRWIPEADAVHAALTPRDLLTMTSGLHHNWFREPPFVGTVMPDQVKDALSLHPDHAVGTWWEYQQTTVTLLLHVLERAVHQDVQTWAQNELFGPLGIADGSWLWTRDRAQNTEGWAHLSMRPGDWARLGQLMLRGGAWNGRQLISSSYVRDSVTPIAQNHAYGYLWWLNGGDSYILPSVYGPQTGPGQLIVGAPRDLYLMAGMQEQRVYVIPSIDMVIVRLGRPGSYELDTRVSVWTGRSGELDYELLRRILGSVTDAHVDVPAPYQGSDVVLPSTNQGLVQDATELNDVMAGAGLFHGPDGCTPAGCN
jgi:CubicO group peptidase (beta-lactamase class C family)